VLNVDGRREWQPQLADDALVAEAFAAHQQRVKDFGAALGSAAPDAMDALLQQAGFHVERAATDWRLGMEGDEGSRDAALLAALIAGEAAAAREAAPEAAVRIDAWEQRRGGLLGENKLTLTIGHCDLLALPA